jgi:predicted nuclease of predicted toxin-antitoxin system
MPKMLLDECMSPQLVPRLWDEGHDVIHVRDRGLLRAADHTLWRYAIEEDRVLCTINGKHFKKLAAATPLHSGLIVIPGGHRPTQQFNLVTLAVSWVIKTNAPTGFVNRYIQTGDHGEIILAEIIYDEQKWGGPIEL